MQCPSCGAEDQESWKFCESCGAVLQLATDSDVNPSTAVEPSTEPVQHAPMADSKGRCRCGAGPELRDSLGYCSVCGLKVTPAKPYDPADHREIVLAPHYAAVTDRGRRHPTNQDDVAISLVSTEGEPVYVIVVCDGLSSSCAAEAASAAASVAACSSLSSAASGPADGMPAAMADAIIEAHRAVCAVPYAPNPDKDGPATTIVAALIKRDTATIGWVGDSRAYLISPGCNRLLTHDHSWANEVVDAGEMTMDEAMSSPEAHVITQCLGPMTNDDGSPAEGPEPSVIQTRMPGKGCLLLCSDGMWNFLQEADSMAARVTELNAEQDAAIIARSLVEYANARGGRDNITVAALCLI